MAGSESLEEDQIPSFVSKLWEMLNSKYFSDYIRWSETGKSFVILNHQGFSKYVLPNVYRHNNLSSFIRQLNMYGFHKKVDNSKSLMHSSGPEYEFFNPYFVIDRVDLLIKIKRKGADSKNSKHDFTAYVSEIETLKSQHDNINIQIEALKLQNTGFYHEIISLREKHERQNETIGRLINFFYALVGNNSKSEALYNQNRLMLLEAPPKSNHCLPTAQAHNSSHSNVTTPFDFLMPSVYPPSQNEKLSPVNQLISTQPVSSSVIPQSQSLIPHPFLNITPPLQSISTKQGLLSESCLNINDSVTDSTKNTSSSDPSPKPPIDVMDFIDLKSSKLDPPPPSYSNNLIIPSKKDISYNIDNLDLDLNSFQNRVVTGDIDNLFKYFENYTPPATLDNKIDFPFNIPTAYPQSFTYDPSNTFNFPENE